MGRAPINLESNGLAGKSYKSHTIAIVNKPLCARVAMERPSKPELVFGIAGPIGVDIDAICVTLGSALKEVQYEAEIIHLTQEMKSHELRTPIEPPTSANFYDEVKFKIAFANALCREADDGSALARIGLNAIGQRRERLFGARDSVPPKAIAYIVRQLKRPDEVGLFRKVYGRQFILVSAYGSSANRCTLIEERLRRDLPPAIEKYEVSSKALELIEKDASEDGDDFGQQLRETFPLADVFIDGLSRPAMEEKIERFIQAFFGRTDIAPSKEEYGMYAAKSASLRSTDLSRQVGAAVFTDDGELVTQGCNEVPKAFGGTYWDLEEPDYRDVRLGYDPNDIIKNELLRDLFDKMSKAKLLLDVALRLGSINQIVKKLTTKKPGRKEADPEGSLATAMVMDVTEYGRVVHAEMCAICDAARIGRSLKGTTLFCTTFPCHNCTKHILAAGIRRVVYMEPYPKSRAKDLHQNEIEIEKESNDRVSFVPFLGISPVRYRDIFQKRGKRKDSDGKARRWLHGSEQPMIEHASDEYIDIELEEVAELIKKTAQPSTPTATKDDSPSWSDYR